MMIFLQILLAVFLVIAALVVLGIWWLRRRVGAATQEYKPVAELQAYLDMRPARIHLRRGDREEFTGPTGALIQALAILGFKRIGDLCDYDSYVAFQVARHVSLPIVSAIRTDSEQQPYYVLFTLDKHRRIVGRGNAPDDSIDLPSLDWQMDTDRRPDIALSELKDLLSEEHTLPGPQEIRATLEQVHAIQLDRRISRAPTREGLEKTAEEHGIALDESQLELAHEIMMTFWLEQINDAVLDRYRRTSKIDAVTWESICDDIHVVHDRLDNDELETLLVIDDTSEKVFRDCVNQGLSGLLLYRAVVERLPPDQRWKELAEVRQPICAVLFEPAEISGTDEAAGGLYFYKATDENDRTQQGSIYATSAGDAKAQLERSGLFNPKILMEPSPVGSESSEFMADEAVASVAARAVEESIGKSLLRALFSNWILWALPLGFLAHSLYEGAPYTWGDYAIGAWTIVSLVLLVFLVSPMVLYDKLQHALVYAKTRQARALLRSLELTGVFSGITREQLRLERCKILAMDGESESALQMWETNRGDMADPEYYAGLSIIYEADGDTERLIDTQRQWANSAPSLEMAHLDLAISLGRHTNDTDGIERILQSMSPADLSEAALAGYQFARGLLAAQRGQGEVAIRHYAQATDTLEPLANAPQAAGLIAEINGWCALEFKRAGDADSAEEIWQQVSPILVLHPSTATLVQAYETA